MLSTYTPWATLAGIATCGVLTEGWTLAQCDDPGTPRCFTFHVPFDSAFAHSPVVHAGLIGFDIDQARTARLTTRVGNITAYGFDLTICTWGDSIVYAVEVSWLAIGQQTN